MAKRQIRKKTVKINPEGCVHKFAATGEKGAWTVEAMPTNNRGGSKNVLVPVTIFKCGLCGETKEYPDFWESNYVVPKRGEPAKRVPKKIAAKRKAKNA